MGVLGVWQADWGERKRENEEKKKIKIKRKSEKEKIKNRKRDERIGIGGEKKSISQQKRRKQVVCNTQK